MNIFSRKFRPLPPVPGDWKYRVGEWQISTFISDTFCRIPSDVGNFSAWGREAAAKAIAEYGQEGPVETARFAAQLAGMAAVCKKFEPAGMYADVEKPGDGVTGEYWGYSSPPRGERSLERLIDFKTTDKLLVKPRETEFVELPAGPALHVHEFINDRFLDVNCVVEYDEYYILSPLVGDVIVHSMSWARLPESEFYTVLSKRMVDQLEVMPV